MLKELGPGLRLTLIFTVLTGLLYPAVMTGVSELIFPKRANGSLVTVGGKVVGSSLIGQPFAKPEYFHPRPSASGCWWGCWWRANRSSWKSRSRARRESLRRWGGC